MSWGALVLPAWLESVVSVEDGVISVVKECGQRERESL